MRETYVEMGANGAFTPEQLKALKPYVEGREVTDLGCAHLVHSHMLVKMGAKKVIGVDRNRTSQPLRFPYQMQVVQIHFDNYHEPVDVAFMSWPVNWSCGLDRIARRADTIIYLGSNMDGSAAGDKDLFEVLRRRENPVYVPSFKNTLAIYGPELVDRPANPEEVAVLDTPDYIWHFYEAHNPFKEGQQVVKTDDWAKEHFGIIKSFDRAYAMVLWDGESEPRPEAFRVLETAPGRYKILGDEEDQSPDVSVL